MGNYRFRFSDMIPNAWFYKLRDMNKSNRNHHSKTLNPTNKKHSSSSSSPSSSSLPAKDHKPHLSDQRKSYYFTRDLSFQPIQKTLPDKPEPPRLSSRRRRSTKRNRRPPPPPRSAGCICRATLDSVWAKPDPDSSPENSSPSSSDLDSVLTEYGSDRDPCSESCKFGAGNDVVIEIIDEENKSSREIDNHLPPIITKKTEPTKMERKSTEVSERNKYGSLSVKVVKENLANSPSPARRVSVTSSSAGVKLRTNSPRIANLRGQGRRSVSSNSSSGGGRRSVSESVAVVKSSKDPGRDFRESMVEMILENNIRGSKDLEELLACYLSLNSDEYHDLIVNVFKQIWFDFIHLRLK